jgi:hypothetical protein
MLIGFATEDEYHEAQWLIHQDMDDRGYFDEPFLGMREWDEDSPF